MNDILADVSRWLEDGGRVAVATVVETWGSAPRRPGAKMALTSDGRITGSVSGGCVESAVVRIGQDVLETGVPQLATFGVADETAWEVGLACGGSITVLVEPLDPDELQFEGEVSEAAGRGLVATVIDGPEAGDKLFWRDGRVVYSSLPPAITESVASLASGIDVPQRVELDDGALLFLDPLRPSPELVIVGGAHIAVALVRLATTLGYRTTVIDPRRAFGSPERFPDAGRLLQRWPAKALAGMDLTEDTAVITLSHDPKIDDPALLAAVGSPAFYIGALGSRRTHAERSERLRSQGVTEDQLARIHAPIGLEIGAADPEEIALAILAEVVAERRRA